MATEPMCCEMECDNPATWDVYCQDGDPYSGTQSCDAHLAELLCGEHAHTVVYLAR